MDEIICVMCEEIVNERDKKNRSLIKQRRESLLFKVLVRKEMIF